MSRWSILALSVLLAGLVGRDSARAQDLVADLSDHLIAIATDFTGTDVVLFGAIDAPGDVAVIVRGPAETMMVRRKDRVAGIWINNAGMTFVDVPSFYGIASNRPVEELADKAVLDRHGIGLDHLRLTPVDADGVSPEVVNAFRAALIRAKQDQDIYAVDRGRIAFLGQRLFRTTIAFPATVPTGQYLVSVFLFRDGALISAQTTPLVVSKIGVGADIFQFAQRHGASYGLIAILMAVAAGWLASAVFRRT